MAAKTLLTVKVDKNLKADAQVTADRLGLPLGTIINAFLLQLVRDQSFTIHYDEKLRRATSETTQNSATSGQ